jgi:hypothetical protein
MISGHLYTAAAADGQHKVIEPIPEKKKTYLVISKEFWPYIFLRPANQLLGGRMGWEYNGP